MKEEQSLDEEQDTAETGILDWSVNVLIVVDFNEALSISLRN